MTLVAGDVDPAGLERKSPTEAADIDEITRGMLALQAQVAASRSDRWRVGRTRRASASGPSSKSSTFAGCQAIRRLAQGIFAAPGVYPAIVRFANADGGHRHPRALRRGDAGEVAGAAVADVE